MIHATGSIEETHVDGFKKFLLRGNVVDLAVAVVIGTAFALVVTAFVEAFIAPLVGVVTGATGRFDEAEFSAGGVDFPYGRFLAALLSFVLIAAVVYFFVVRPMSAFLERYKTEPELDSVTKQCPECLSNIPVPASRCAFCTVEQLDVPR
jgi:large conductance mechanosensitive channel